MDSYWFFIFLRAYTQPLTKHPAIWITYFIACRMSRCLSGSRQDSKVNQILQQNNISNPTFWAKKRYFIIFPLDSCIDIIIFNIALRKSNKIIIE